MAWTLRDPWPAPAETDGIVAQEVSFPSSSPFTPAEAGPSAEPTTALGHLYLPRSRPRGAPAASRSVPAVVLLHGAGGVLPAREHLYGRQLAAMGAAALVVDVFGARRDRATGFTERLLEITETMALADAYAALRFLSRRPEIDPRRVALVGFSYGAMASTYGVWATAAERLAPGGERFAAHAAFYGPCIARFEVRRTTGAPVLMLYGESDELIVPERCAEFAQDLRAGGSRVELISYAGALHQWDGGLPRRTVGRLLGACRLRVERDGTVRDERTGLPMSGPILRRIILAACVEDRPYLIGADDTVRTRSNRDLGRFLDGMFRGGAARGVAR
ncbi:MAG: dienelactone hydrolase family protein [Acetobacteraceae bacterium]|nr:dienelactone hydrolase family protein [Acetobacteraceae bacterium]